MFYNISAKVVSFLTTDKSNRNTAIYVQANSDTLSRTYIKIVNVAKLTTL